MRILVDMDDVIADFDGTFLKAWRGKYPDKFYVPMSKRTTFYMADQYPKELHGLIKETYQAPGFVRSIKPIKGYKKALTEMVNEGHEVFICTSPLNHYKNCVLEKYEWVDEHLGDDWVKKIILTKDKTIVSGDYLIDDKPNIKGVQKPVWEQIIFDKPYNRHLNMKRLKRWKDWKEALKS